MWRTVLAIPLLALSAGGENLLLNPGFERMEGPLPVGWHVFVMPEEGALGRVDGDVKLEGERSVMLRNGRAYEKEPVNNWSQNVVTDVGGKALTVTGSIKTEDATEAALWLQCFQSRPCSVIAFATTTTDTPLRGTHDWTPVRMTVNVPEKTDFVVLRCVLKGTGAAWFDSVCVGTPVDEETSVGKEAGRPGEDMTVDEAASLIAEKLAEALAYEDISPASAGLSAELIEAHRELVKANRGMREANEGLLTRIQGLEAELDALREDIGRATANAPEPGAPDPAERPVPPLVPHGYVLEGPH